MINVNLLLTNPKGQTIVVPPDDTKMTVGQACIIALDAALETDAKEGLRSKMRRGRLIEAIVEAEANGGMIDLPVEDVAMIKERLAQTITSAYLVRKICLHLDPAAKE